MNKVYIIWNPLLEKIVCVHSSDDKTCNKCDNASELLSKTPYSLEGVWMKIDSNEDLCYCGSSIDETNPDCVEFKLCKEHALDA